MACEGEVEDVSLVLLLSMGAASGAAAAESDEEAAALLMCLAQREREEDDAALLCLSLGAAGAAGPSAASEGGAKKKKRVRWAAMDKMAGDHVCMTCGKSFSTFQALGGHRTAHSRGLRLEVSDPKITRQRVKKKQLSELYKCEICGLGFETGHAMGGHLGKYRIEMPRNWLEKNSHSRVPVLLNLLG
jgi:DNA-directed RNA polymerase subunit RPC12/RpoP